MKFVNWGIIGMLVIAVLMVVAVCNPPKSNAEQTPKPTPPSAAETLVSSIKREAQSFIAKGRAMEKMRADLELYDDLTCIKTMRKLQAGALLLEERAKPLRLSPSNALLKAAVSRLSVCVSCTSAATQMCQYAENEIAEMAEWE